MVGVITVDYFEDKEKKSKKPVEGVEGKGVFSEIYRLKKRELNEDDDEDEGEIILVNSYGCE